MEKQKASREFHGLYTPWTHNTTERFSLSHLYFSRINKTLCLLAESGNTLCDPMDCSPSGFSVHGILQARTLEWVSIFFSINKSTLQLIYYITFCFKNIRKQYFFIGIIFSMTRTFKIYCLVAQMVKNQSALQETWVQSLGREDPLEKWMATHPSILAWRTPWTEEPGRLQSMGSQRVGHNWVTERLQPPLNF